MVKRLPAGGFGLFLQDHGKNGPFPQAALTGYLPVELLADTLDDGETQSGGWLAIRRQGGYLAVFGKKMRQLVLFDAHTLIPHLDADGVPLLADTHPDILSLLGVLDGIRQKVPRHTGQQLPVAEKIKTFLRTLEPQPDILPGSRRLESIDDAFRKNTQ